MKIALIDNVLLRQDADVYTVDPQPHLGLISLAAVARAQGHEAVLIDPKLELLRGEVALGHHFYEQVAERIMAGDPDVVGFTSLGCNFVCTLRIADAVRRRRDVPILLGGPHASILDREILTRYRQFDVIVRYEAEATLPSVMAAVAGDTAFCDVPSISYRAHDEVMRTNAGTMVIDPDELPFPAYDAYPIAELGLTQLNVEAGRGCPFECAFCSTASFFGRRYRIKSAPRLVADLDRLHATYGIRHFDLAHDLFTVNKAKVRAFCDAVADRGYTWSCSARMDCVDEALLGCMREAGCVSIYYGVEAGSQQLQSAVKKRLDLRLYRPVVDASLDLGMATTVSFITGYPNERPEDQEATVQLVASSIRSYPDHLLVQLHLLTPEPGTAFHELYGDVLAYDGYITDFNFPPLHIDDASLMRADPAVFVCQQHYTAGCDRSENIALVEGYRKLHGLGHAVLRMMLASFDGSASELFRRCGRLARRTDLPHAELILAFVAQEWGKSHPLYDICAYLRGLSKLRPDSCERIASADGSTRIRLAWCIAPIGLVRNGEAIAACLRAGEDVDPRSPRRWSIIVGDAALDGYRIFDVDRRTFGIVEELRAGTTPDHLVARFGARAARTSLWSLGLMGALVRDDPATEDDASYPDSAWPVHRAVRIVPASQLVPVSAAVRV
ncbi:MAG TPA: radical SAM protein [Candidatus Acidoferrum sp.]|nr:radical SAM protein [Candidatus Acidoferrum sp.]